MAGIIYTAVDRGQLITDSPAHTAGTDYSIDVKLRGYSTNIEAPKKTHVAIAGNTESVLKRTAKVLATDFIWPDESNADAEEWLYSIAGGERFSFDAYGSIAVPDNAIDVVCMNPDFNIRRMSHGAAPWRSVALTLRFAL